MDRYIVEIGDIAREHLRKIYKSGNKSDIKNVEIILKELEIHPKIGKGQPEELKYQLTGLWSRRINKKDRLIYEINENEVIVTIISANGHY